ncbi:MAG: protein kinase [Gemmatimonadales bacterium]
MTESTLRDQLQASLDTAYTIQRELGGGGMSRVFVARDETLGRDVVIKVLPRELAAEMSAERFTREIKLAAALQHPHVLPVLSAGISDGLPYYMMPFVRGESLRTAMVKGVLSLDEKLDILRDIARALRYAHGEGIVHRDIKPENILLSSGSAVVVDFGIAKALSASRTQAPGGTLTIVGTSIGTPAYMSPEQAAADPNIDHRSDIYSWGVMAYELLAGKYPFEGKTTPQQFLGAHLAETPVSLATVTRVVPQAAVDVIMSALEKDPDKRPQTGDELLTRLGGVSSTSGQSPAIAGWSKRSWKRPAIGVGVVVALALGFAALKGTRSASAKEPIMLAVLPFENQGPAEQEYFVDGLTDAVNGKLAGLAGISVIDRRSTAAYKKTTKPVKQIGTELGVAYVLGGVVRWARTDSTWQAQVIPTLVNTSDATTRWAGEPLVVSSADPFSAQTEIATKVAGALKVALGSDEREDLAKRPTENIGAYDAYLRAKSVYEANWKVSTSIRVMDQSIAELQRAIGLDPKFAQAWALLANVAYERAGEVPGDTVSLRVAMESARQAEALAPNDPVVVMIRSAIAFMQGAQDRGIKIIGDALRNGIASPELLATHAADMLDVGQPDSARANMEQAIRMNPRYPPTLLAAARLAEDQKDWATMNRYARTLVGIDPTDERGWSLLAAIARKRGDSTGMRNTIEEAFKYIPSPSNLVLVFMAYAGTEMGSRFIAMTPEQIHIETLPDSVGTYYDNKADYFVGRGEPARAKIYYDSIIAKLEGRNLSGSGEPSIRLYLANAYAFNNRLPEAKREVERAMAAARALKDTRPDGSLDLNSRILAAVYGKLGRYDDAIREARALLKHDSWTRAGLAREPKLRGLRGNPAYEAFLREKEN